MRRSHQLKPDTFPFLAVLLCAMGSLIVILLVLDRQARRQQQAKAEAKTKAALTDRQRELAEQRKRQHEILARHQQEIQRLKEQHDRAALQRRAKELQLQNLASALTQSAAVLKKTQTKREEIAGQLRQARAQVAQGLQNVNAQTESVKQTLRTVQKKEKDRFALSEDLADLATKLQDLREKKEKDDQTWSIVPYKGKLGENRRPLYVECTEEGLIFYPDRKVMLGYNTTPMQVRKEVLYRMSLMQLSSDTPTYWLLLIRPNGILRYYQFLTAIRGLSLVYGYELVDKDWKIDLPLAGKLPELKGSGKQGTVLGSPRGRGSSTGDDAPGEFSATRVLSSLQDPALLPIPGTGNARPEGTKPGQNPVRRGGGGFPTIPTLPPPADRTKGNDKGQKGQKGTGQSTKKPAVLHPPKKRDNAQGQPGGQPGSASRPNGNTLSGAKRKPLEPAPRYVERDWEMLIECTAGGVILLHTGQTIDLQTLRREDGKQQLLQLCLRVIERQRKYLPTKPEDFHPRLRFVVHDDGLRSYHLAYPALRALQIPKTAVMKQR